MPFREMKQLLYYALQKSGLDFKSINNRLTALKSRHAEPSGVYSNNYPSSKPTRRLLDLLSKAAVQSPSVEMNLFSSRPNVPEYVFEFPGEHYRLLQSLVQITGASRLVEIGTFTGLSSLGFLQVMDENKSLCTFDIVPWDNFKDTVLMKEDFKNYNFKQVLDDLSYIEVMVKYEAIFLESDFIFCDGPKDGVFERKILQNLQKLGIKNGTIIFFDDIKQWNMLEIWSEIKMPKLDLTSIGHFTGSGIVEWDNEISCF
jgi:predicted O-methyltransferase YrrM